jgi:pyruvate dehydrogenase E1 component alpha subunit
LPAIGNAILPSYIEREKSMADQTAPSNQPHAGYTEITPDQTERVRAKVSDEKIMAIYTDMLRIRRFEERAGRAYQQGKIKGFCHLYIGQEGVAVGAMHAIGDDDYVVAAYREHGHAIARGVEPDAVMAELFGKAEGSSGGMGGSMHIFDTERKFYGGWGIVGGHVPTAAGIGWAIKYREEDAVCLCFFGEGSIHQGAFHETLNMAALWKLPVIFITENNKYAMGTEVSRASAITELEKKAISYGIAHDTIDGQNVFSVWEAIDAAVERAKKDGMPTFLDIRTYRYRGHSMSDPATYRTKEEVEEEQLRDPIQRLHNWIVDQEIATDEQLQALDKELKDEAKANEKFAMNGSQPALNALYDHVYVDWPFDIEGPELP